MSITDKIAQIIAKAESTTSPDEAETFMAKAKSLMEVHGISLLELGTLEEKDPVDMSHDCGYSFASEGWVRHIAGQLGRYYGCQVISVPAGRNKVTYSVAGRESARITFTMMLPYVVKEVRRHSREATNAGEFKTISRAKTAIGNAMTFRLQRMVHDAKARTEAEMPKATANALVPVDAIDSAVKLAFPVLNKSRRVSLKTNSDAQRRAGQINVNSQMTTSGGPKRLK